MLFTKHVYVLDKIFLCVNIFKAYLKKQYLFRR